MLSLLYPQEVLGASGSSQAQQAPGAVHKQMLELLLWIQTLARETGAVVVFQYTYGHLCGLNFLSGLARYLAWESLPDLNGGRSALAVVLPLSCLSTCLLEGRDEYIFRSSALWLSWEQEGSWPSTRVCP